MHTSSVTQYPLTPTQARAIKRQLERKRPKHTFRIIGRSPHLFVEERPLVSDGEGTPVMASRVLIYGRPLRPHPQRKARKARKPRKLKPARAA